MHRTTYINKCPGNRAHVGTRLSVTRTRQGCVELDIVGEVWCLLFNSTKPLPGAQFSPASRLIAELLAWLKISWLKVLFSGGAGPLVFVRVRTVVGDKDFNCSCLKHDVRGGGRHLVALPTRAGGFAFHFWALGLASL